MNALRLVLLLALVGMRVCGQSTPPVRLSTETSLRQTTNASSIAGAPRSEEVVLTGIADLASYKRAFVRIDLPGQAPQFHTLAEGESSGAVTLVSIDSQKARVTLRYRGEVRVISMNARTSGLPSTIDLQRDVSHSAHHTRRAQLDRENDERSAAEGAEH
jgi:hypothetical protein